MFVLNSFVYGFSFGLTESKRKKDKKVKVAF